MRMSYGWLVFMAPAVAGAQFVEPGVSVLHTFTGDSPGEMFGWAVSELADIDGDGIREVMVAGATSGHAGPNSGRVYVYSGESGARLFRFDGLAGERLGWSIADGGDLDRDGWNDILVGAPGVGAGRVYIRSGRDGEVIDVVDGELAGDFFGFAVGGVGDADGDGHPDFVVGAGRASARGPFAGSAYLYSGSDRTLLHRVDGAAGDFHGTGAAGTGDVDGDGRGDFIVGARNAGAGQAGRATVYSGASGLPLYPPLAPSAGGVDFGFFFVAGVGDVDGDGRPDLYVGDPTDAGNGAGSGRAYVFAGRDGRPLYEFGGAAGDGAGCGRGARDVDGDRRADIIVGSYTSFAGGPFAGKATVYSGCTGAALRTFTSTTAGETFGYDSVGIGDVNDDGEGDFLISATFGETAYVVAGAKTCVADFDRDGRVTRRDSIAFVLAVLLRDPRADTNCDGRVDVRDSLNFLRTVLVGCG